MQIKSFFLQEIPLPAFSKRAFLFALLMVLLPNLAFLGLAWLSDTARPLINLDYLIAALLLVLPWRPLKWLGVAAFLVAALFDGLMFVMQLFPFMDLNGAIYLAPFLFNAPLLYRLLAGGFLLYALLMPWLLEKIGRQTDIAHVAGLAAVLAVAAYFSGHLQYYERDKQFILFGANNFYYGKSQFGLYMAAQNIDFLKEMQTQPMFSSLNFPRAVQHLNPVGSNKILLVVNESWGEPQNPALQKAVLQGLLAQPAFENVQHDSFLFVGATVEGEMRELCNASVKGFALKLAPPQQFADCLPMQYRQQGYETVAMHGASSQMYDRFSWYPKAGFQKALFGEQFLGKPRCEAFNGVCDSALFDEVGKAFSTNDKLFFYWLTLTTHSTYPEKDLFNRRLKCEDYGLPADTMMCRNFSLQAQFFDGLAELLKQPEMSGTEVLVVGDHSPPVVNLGETFKYMKQGEVAWVHFKVR